MSIGPGWKTDAYLMQSGMCRVSPPEESASFVISPASLPHCPTGSTCPNARSALTDRLACLRGGGGKKGDVDEWEIRVIASTN